MNKKLTGLMFTLLIGAIGAGFTSQASAQVSVHISNGWHGDRYYDGHRYWNRDEWNRNHPPHHRDFHHRDDHRDHHG